MLIILLITINLYALQCIYLYFTGIMALLDYYYSNPWDTSIGPKVFGNPWLTHASTQAFPDYHLQVTAQVGDNNYLIPDELIKSSPVLTTLRHYEDGPINLSHIINPKQCKKIFACINNSRPVPPHLLVPCARLCDYLDVSFPLFLRLIHTIYALPENQFHRFSYFLYFLLLTIYRPIVEWILLQGLSMPPSVVYSHSPSQLLTIGKKQKRRARKVKLSLNKTVLPDPFYTPECWD